MIRWGEGGMTLAKVKVSVVELAEMPELRECIELAKMPKLDEVDELAETPELVKGCLKLSKSEVGLSAV